MWRQFLEPEIQFYSGSKNMPGRARGYHYVRLPNGRKKRVYNTGRRGGRRQGGYRKAKGGYGRKTYRGYGDYTRVASASYRRHMGGRSNGKMMNTVPVIKNSKGGVVRIQHTEFLGDVESSVAFQNNSFYLNPGISLSDGGFTEWLWQVAGNFEEWKARGICFHFKSTSAEYSNATGSALGTVSLATSYNVLNSPFTSKIQMENYEGSTSTKPSKNMNMFVECANKQTPLHPMYIRTSPAIPTNADQRMYDLGIFQLATSGMNSAGATVGELWVSYEIDFFKPRINADPQGIYDHFQIPASANVLPASPFGTSTTGLIYPTTDSSAGGAVSPGIVTAANCVPSPTTASRDNFAGGVPTSNGTGTSLGPTTANTYYFPPGAPIGSIWMIQYDAGAFTAGAPGAWTITDYQCSGALLLTGNTASAFTNSGSSATNLMLTVFIKITAAYANIVLTNGGAQSNNAGAQQADLWVVQLGQPVN